MEKSQTIATYPPPPFYYADFPAVSASDFPLRPPPIPSAPAAAFRLKRRRDADEEADVPEGPTKRRKIEKKEDVSDLRMELKLLSFDFVEVLTALCKDCSTVGHPSLETKLDEGDVSVNVQEFMRVSTWEEKMAQLDERVRSFSSLLNSYLPLHAKAQIAALLRSQLDERKKGLDGLRHAIEKCKEGIQHLKTLKTD